MRDTGEGNSIIYEMGLGFAGLRQGRTSGHVRYLKSCHIKHLLTFCSYYHTLPRMQGSRHEVLDP
jgi:hypothetical protein